MVVEPQFWDHAFSIPRSLITNLHFLQYGSKTMKLIDYDQFFYILISAETNS